MKAIVRSAYGTADVLRLEEVPTPVPKEDEALVRMRASSVNRTDLESLAGRPAMYRAFMGVRRPRHKFLGLDAAGEVLATVGELVLAGTLKPVIDRRYTLADVPDALRYFAAGKVRGKLVITMP